MVKNRPTMNPGTLTPKGGMIGSLDMTTKLENKNLFKISGQCSHQIVECC
jgi:hypothetical protein